MIEKTCEYGTAIFEDQSVTETDLPTRYPELQFLKLHQVHSELMIEASKEADKADGHWSFEPNQALLIQTADCMPVIMLGPNSVFSLHAGWRGIEQNIIQSAARKMKEFKQNPEDFFVFIGPHIKSASFEVGRDVADRLLGSLPNGFSSFSSKALIGHRDPEKAFIDLDIIAKAQLESAGFRDERIWISDVDTVADKHYHSYRREKTSGRQWSFGFLAKA